MLLQLINFHVPAIVDNADYQRLSKFNWEYNGKSNIQRKFTENGKTIHVSLAAEVMEQSEQMFDHKDRDYFNNIKSNLRPCTTSQNAMNRIKQKVGKSQFKGVTWQESIKKWKARIKANGVEVYLGLFVNELDAAKAYNDAAIIHFGEFALLNKI